MADYSKSYIYKLFCKDKKVKDIYIGCCANPEHDDILIPTRLPWEGHLHRSKIEGGRRYNMGLYKFIREHGGADNWDYEVTEFKCSSQLELLTEKKRIMDILKPSLNTRPAMYSIGNDRIKCQCGGYTSINDKSRRQHQKTIMHINWLKEQPIETKLKGNITEHKEKGKLIISFRHQINGKRYAKGWTVGKRSYEDSIALAKQYQIEHNKLLYSNKEPIVEKLKGNIREYKTHIRFCHMIKGKTVSKKWSIGKTRTYEEGMTLAKEYQLQYNKMLDSNKESIVKEPIENKEPIVIDLKGSINKIIKHGKPVIRFRQITKGKAHSKQWTVSKKRTLEEAMNLAKQYQIEYNKKLNTIN